MTNIGKTASSERIAMTAIDALQFFIGGNVTTVEIIVKARETTDGKSDGEEEDSDDEGHRIGFECLTEIIGSAITVDTSSEGYFYNTKTKSEDHVGEHGVDEEKKVAVVADANTIAHPRAVVIIHHHTVVTHGAMRSPGRAPDVAGLAVFAGDPPLADLVDQRLGVLTTVVDGRSSRYDAGIDESCEEKRDCGYDQECA